MKHDFALHPAQVTILRELLFRPDARFSDLNKTDLTSDHFTFHVKQLITAELVTKTNDLYSLTPKGKEFANRFDTDSTAATVEKQAKLSVAICCTKEENGTTYYLLQQRLKHPYFGFWGFMTGKVKWGESVFDTAKRELTEEMGISADLTLCAVKHNFDRDESGKLLEDKYFFIIKGTHVQGDLITEYEGGKNAWLTKEQMHELPEVFYDLWEGIDIISQPALTFSEHSYTVGKY